MVEYYEVTFDSIKVILNSASLSGLSSSKPYFRQPFFRQFLWFNIHKPSNHLYPPSSSSSIIYDCLWTWRWTKTNFLLSFVTDRPIKVFFNPSVLPSRSQCRFFDCSPMSKYTIQPNIHIEQVLHIRLYPIVSVCRKGPNNFMVSFLIDH